MRKADDDDDAFILNDATIHHVFFFRLNITAFISASLLSISPVLSLQTGVTWIGARRTTEH